MKPPYSPLTMTTHADDDNRIVLQPLSGQEDCQSDYINACYVDVSVCAKPLYGLCCQLLWP